MPYFALDTQIVRLAAVWFRLLNSDVRRLMNDMTPLMCLTSRKHSAISVRISGPF